MKNPKMSSKKMRLNKMGILGWILCVILMVYAIGIIIPYVLAIMFSFKTNIDFNEHMFSLTKPSLNAFRDVIDQFKSGSVILKDGSRAVYDFWGMTFNSFAYALGAAFTMTMIPCIASYCSARFKFFLSPILEYIVYFVMTVPLMGTTQSTVQIFKTLHMYDSIPAMWFAKSSFTGMYFLLLHAQFKNLPNDYAEAAYVDGAGNFRIFFQIMLPLVSNTLTMMFVLNFVGLWSDYSSNLFFFPNKPTLALTLLNIKDSNISTPTLMAASVYICLPSLVLYILFNDKFTTNLQIGGIKG